MPLMTEIPENWREPAARMVTSLRGLDRVLVAAHVNPDGDALGSMSALGWLLKDMRIILSSLKTMLILT